MAPGARCSLDYAALQRDRARLQHDLVQLQAVGRSEFERWPPADRRAFLINAYNAWTVELILRAWPDLASIRDLGSLFVSPWKRRWFHLLGAERSLDEVEHTLLRGAPDHDDPRIHCAVNCASIGCPALRPEACRGADLDAQLDDQTRRFLRDRTRNRLEGDTLYLPRIFDWYAEDFEQPFRGATTVPAFLALYADAIGLDAAARARLAAGAIGIDYLPYDRVLNSRTP